MKGIHKRSPLPDHTAKPLRVMVDASLDYSETSSTLSAARGYPCLSRKDEVSPEILPRRFNLKPLSRIPSTIKGPELGPDLLFRGFDSTKLEKA